MWYRIRAAEERAKAVEEAEAKDASPPHIARSIVAGWGRRDVAEMEQTLPAAVPAALGSAGKDAAASLAVVLHCPAEAADDQLTGHIRSFYDRVYATRDKQEQWANQVEDYLSTLVPWKPSVFHRFGSIFIGWCLPDSDLDISLVVPPRTTVNGNVFLEHALKTLEFAEAQFASAGTAGVVSRVKDAIQGHQNVKHTPPPIPAGLSLPCRSPPGG